MDVRGDGSGLAEEAGAGQNPQASAALIRLGQLEVAGGWVFEHLARVEHGTGAGLEFHPGEAQVAGDLLEGGDPPFEVWAVSETAVHDADRWGLEAAGTGAQGC